MKITLSPLLSFLHIILLSCVTASCSVAQVVIANHGKSTFAVVIPAKAPSTVQAAALELQKDIQLSTGAKLPIAKDNTAIHSPVISLGSTIQAKNAGLNTAGMKEESYRIVTKNGNLYILGPDTPDGGWTKDGGISNGTANGVYVFLEDYLGVRWLMPGEIGLDIPTKSTFAVADIDRTETPRFNFRQFVAGSYYYSSSQQLQQIEEWMNHMHIGTTGGGDLDLFTGSVNLDYNHNFWGALNDQKTHQVNTPAIKELYKEHADWFAMDANGKRPYPRDIGAKLETTNQDLVQYFADQAVKVIKSSDRPRSFSLSPSDGRGWSQSPASKALYDPAPTTKTAENLDGFPSMSSLVLKWYHDVSQAVAKQCPDCKLSGYLYQDYVYPPQKLQMKLPDNFTPMLATSFDYGYQLYHPEVQQEFRTIMDSWAKVAPKDWYYFDLPNILLRQYAADVGSANYPVNFPASTGIVMPVAPDILNTVFPTLLRDHIKGAVLYGVPSWSSCAMNNYVLAKLAWNPTLNANDVQRDWLDHAYGAKAGAVMQQFYSNLNSWYRAYYQQGKDQNYQLTINMLRDIYAAHYPEMEKVLLQAEAQPMTAPQQKRLQLIEDNLIVLQWRLRNANLLPTNFSSALNRSNEQVINILETPNADFPMFPGVVQTNPDAWLSPKPFPWNVTLNKVDKNSDAFPAALNENTTVLYATKDGDINLMPQLVTQGAYFASYEIKNQSGQRVRAGVLNAGAPISFPAKANQTYYLMVVPRTGVNYKIEIANAALADGAYDASTKTLNLTGKVASVEVFHVPGNSPIGYTEESGTVTIQKPFVGAERVAGLLRSGKYSTARVLASLADGWRFSPDPQNKLLAQDVTKPDYDDSSWKTINALSWWQPQGFSDYHGAAWYRKKFPLPSLQQNEQARIYFGSADGDVTVYLNGYKLMEHKLGPAPMYDGWNKSFTWNIPPAWLKPTGNVLAVEVTSKSETTASGITGGVAIIGRIAK
jgi:hypothetical protein